MPDGSSRPFKGKIALDIRDSVPDWEPYLAPRAQDGAPNVLLIAFPLKRRRSTTWSWT